MYKTQTIEINNEIWEKYKDTHSRYIRDKILLRYLYIVTVNAKRMSAIYKNKAELEDIVNQGVLALIDCIERFDCRKGVQFDSFASIRVRGSIIDYIRKQDWVPRDIRKKSIDIGNAYSELQTFLDRMPEDEEVAKHVGIDLEEFNKIMAQSSSFSMLSYEELLYDSTSYFKEPVSTTEIPDKKYQEQELKNIIAMSIDKLNDKERLIISLYYYEELKLKEIAAVLGLSASRVSQLHSKALFKMKKVIGDYIKE